MRLHTDVLTRFDLIAMAADGPIAFEQLTEHGSRSHARAFEVKLTGSGTHTNSGSYGARTDVQAATWDEWGIFLGRLYDLDPQMLAGTPKRPIYAGLNDFHYQTGERFDPVRGITWEQQHKSRHAWRTDWDSGGWSRECKCGATMYPPLRG